MQYYFKTITSPVGTLRLIASDKGLCAVLWDRDDPNRTGVSPGIENGSHPVLVEAEKQLNEYFQKKRKVFSVVLDFEVPIFKRKSGRRYSQFLLAKREPMGKSLSRLAIPKQYVPLAAQQTAIRFAS